MHLQSTDRPQSMRDTRERYTHQGLKCKNKQKRIKKTWLQILNIHYLQMGRLSGDKVSGFTHALESCKVKGLYTAVPDATKSYSHTL